MPPKKRTAEAVDLDPSKLSVAQLKEELKKRGCAYTGNKAQLVSRLEDALNAPPSTTKKSKQLADSGQDGDGATAVDFSKLKVTELREECEKRGLDSSGKKAELVSRLEGSSSTCASTSKATSSAKTKVSSSAKVKAEPGAAQEEETDYSKAKRALATTQPANKKKKNQPKVDSHITSASMYEVEGDWDCMLNQTNIGQNNNKYYVIQLLRRQGSHPPIYYVWNRWGRVGEPGQNTMKGPFKSIENAEKEFTKKFSDKTKNKWENRHKFAAVPGKYTLIEMDDDSGDEEEISGKLAALEEVDAPKPKAVVKPSSLDKSTQELVKLIFNNDMFKEAMQRMEIDTKKMPLGKLSKAQIAKGFEALEAIEEELKSGRSSGSKLSELTSKFYTIIPHDFGRRVPPVIRDAETLQKKFDMLLVLGDIEIAQGIERDKEKKQKEAGDEVPHPLDMNYELLKTDLTVLDKKSSEFGVIEKYLQSTEPCYRKLVILDAWRVDRHKVDERFKEHEAIDNRRLLWHGTNVAVVAAILKSGLRIMPHSGGRVGRGIYFASENSKSAGYVRTSGNTGIMFLNEVALGKEHHITRDDHTLTSAPKGFDCVIAKGQTEPDPKDDVTITLGGKAVQVPQGKPISMPQYSSSYFSQSEYLVYKESQARIRYLLKLKF